MTDRVLVGGSGGFSGLPLVKQIVAQGAGLALADTGAKGQLSNLLGVMGQIKFGQADIGPLQQNNRRDWRYYPHVYHLPANPSASPRVDISALARLGNRAELSLTGGLQTTMNWFEHELR